MTQHRFRAETDRAFRPGFLAGFPLGVQLGVPSGFLLAFLLAILRGFLRTLLRASAAAFAAAALLGAAQAQIVADPQAPGPQRPTVLSAPNGLPLVNIQTPSAAGVSRNLYRRFDVMRPGAILNNSRQPVQTQLGGWVPANPWLATGPARVILNEVNSADPSLLQGWVEVAGPRAELVIANPAGIQVDGAGFINTSRLTLSTGTPLLQGGALEAYRVQRGVVGIGGAGLDAREADSTTILARAVQLNARLWAQRLQLITGANTVAAADPALLGAATPLGEAPRLALDVAELGGMYAGHIRLIGTEAGVGVNSLGVLSAEAGDLVLEANGWLHNGGGLYASGALQLQASGPVTQAPGGEMAAQRLALGAGGAIAAQGRLASSEDLALTAAQLDLHGATLAAGGRLSLSTQGALNTDAATLQAAHIEARAASVSNRRGAWAQIQRGGAGDGGISVLSQGLFDNREGSVAGAGPLRLSSLGLDNTLGSLVAAGDAEIHTQGGALINRGGRIGAQGSLRLDSGALSNQAWDGRAARIGAGLDLSLRASALQNRAGVAADGSAVLASLWAGRGLAITSGGELLNTGQLFAEDFLTIDAGALQNSGTVEADRLVLRSTGLLHNAAGASLLAQQSLALQAGTVDNQSLIHVAPGGEGGFHASVGTFNNRSGGAVYADRIAIQAQTLNNRPDPGQGQAPVIAAREDLQLGLHTLNNEDGGLLYSGGALGIGGDLYGGAYAIGAADAVNNLSATIEAQGDIDLSARTLHNERRGVSVSTVPVLDQRAELAMPSWWVNGKNEFGAPIEATSNYAPLLYYLVDPAAILSEQPLVTPDGNRLRRIELALDPRDSVFFAASGAYAAYRGVRERITPGAASTVVLYASERRDDVANPDQVPGAPEVFGAHLSAVTEWQNDTLSYGPEHGRCSTACTLLVVQPGFSDPLRDLLRSDQTNLVPLHPGLEVARTARHTAVEDRLDAGAGEVAAIRAGGGMELNLGESLLNRHGDVLAGGVLRIDAPAAAVRSEGTELKRTHRFALTSHTAGMGSFDWVKPDIDELIGAVPARLSGKQGLHVQARDLSNTSQGRATGLAGASQQFVGVKLPDQSAPLVLADSRLFRRASPGQGYLVETDPLFAQRGAWLGSDYLLRHWALDSALALKRLGDGFYEQKLVREQVAQLSGRRYLGDFRDDEAQFRALMDSGLAYAQAVGLKPGIALTAEQMAQLSTDLVWLVQQDVVLADGTRTQALVPRVYLRAVPPDELLPTGALLAGKNVVLDIQQDLLNAGGRIEGGAVLAQAGRDLSNIGGLMQARSELLARAGRHLSISSPTHSTSFSGEHVQQNRTELAAVGAVRVKGDEAGARLSLSAGQDLVLQGASVSNASQGGSTRLDAGRDLLLQTVTVGSGHSVVADERNQRRASESQELGSDIAALGDIQVAAGRDVLARAASVQALGDVAVQAGRDIRLEAGRARSESESRVYQQRSGLLSSQSREEAHSASSDLALGSSVGGAKVVMEAGRDIGVKGSEVNAQQLLLLDAKRDVVIASEENTESGALFLATKRSGFSNDVMGGLSYGKSQQNTSHSYSALTQSGSSVSGAEVHIRSGRDALVRSSVVLADRDITITAGRDARIEAASDKLASSADSRSKSSSLGINPGASGRYTAFGSVKAEQDGAVASDRAVQSLLSANGGSLTVIAGTDEQYKGSGFGNVNTQGGTLLAKGAVSLSGNRVTLNTADSHTDNQSRAQTKTFTVGSQLSGVIGSAVTGVGDMVEISRHSDNQRLQAAATLKAGYDAYKLSQLNGADLAAGLGSGGRAAQGGDPSGASFGVSASVGSTQSRQAERQSSAHQAGTVVQATQIHIQARETDVAATGAKLQAEDVSLQAERRIHLQAAQNTTELRSSNSGGSAALGVTVGIGDQNGISFQVSASRARGSGQGSETTHDNTSVTGTRSVVLRSGGDTNLRGAQVAGRTVIADIGGDLNIRSLQDTSRYESEQESAGVSLSVCVPPICYGNMLSGAVSMARETIDHDFQSVKQQSGIAAGAGGFDIRVAGNTHLQAAAITSSAEKSSNQLSTASLSYSDLTNTQTTRADSESASVGYGGGSLVSTLAANVAANALANEVGQRGLPQDRHETSTTQSVIGPALVVISGGASKATDAQSEANAATLTARDGNSANAALSNTLTLQQAHQLKEQQDTTRQNQIAANYVGAVITNAVGDVAQQQGWPEGSWQKTALHGMAGVIQAQVAGSSAGQAVTAAVLNEQLAPVLADYLQSRGIDPRSAEFKALMLAGSALVGSTFDAATVTVTATLNNYLKHAELKQKAQQLAQCATAACRSEVQARWEQVSQNRNAQMEGSCQQGGAEGCRANVAEMQRDLSELQRAEGDFNKALGGLTPEERNNIKQVMALTRTNLEELAQLGNQQLGTTYAAPRELVAAGILTDQEGALLEAARAGSMVNFLGAVVLPAGVKGGQVRATRKADADIGRTSPDKGKPTGTPLAEVFFRGGTSLKARLNVDVKTAPDGLVHPIGKNGKAQGLSLNLDPKDQFIQQYGGAFPVNSLPDGLQAVQSGRPGHFVIAPAVPMSFDRYQQLLDQVRLGTYNVIR